MNRPAKSSASRAGRVLGAVLAASLLSAGAESQVSPLCADCAPERVASCGGFLEGPNFDAAGTLWVVDYRTGNILTVADGVCTVVATTGGAANGARFGPDGRLYIADAKRGVLILDPVTRALTVWIDQLDGAPMVGANDLVFDAAGNLYLTVRGASTYLDPGGRVAVVPYGDGAARVLARGLRFPNGIAVTPQGSQLFVGLFSEKAVLSINLAADTLEPQLSYVFVRTDGGVGPDGLMLDARGRLWWANFGAGSVSVADSAARVLGTARLGDAAGMRTTNMVAHDGYLWITEADRGEIWRIRLDEPRMAPADQ